ncbi:hypothetical protein M218_22535 [Burkholderia pseudomallei MSHR338]|nr:hypothetical protein M218_22535 [Burkholderia pseudomallei MSHR338]
MQAVGRFTAATATTTSLGAVDALHPAFSMDLLQT